MIDANRQERDTRAKSPEKRVSISETAKRMTFKKVLLTIDSILCSCIEESDYLRTFDCYSSGIAMDVYSDVPCLDMIIKSSSSDPKHLCHLNFLIVSICFNGWKNRSHNFIM